MNHSPPRVALITGAARRIGAAIAQYLHQAGFDVIVHAHQSQQAAHALCQTLNHIRPNSAMCCVADLLAPGTPAYLIEQTKQWKNTLTLLINNASLFFKDGSDPLNPVQWARAFTVNVQAPFYLSHLAYPLLVTQKGSIINLTDAHTTRPLKGYSLYCQTKAALNMQTLTLAQAFAPCVRVNAIAPGVISWPEGDNTLSEESKQTILSQTLLQQAGHPDDISKTALFLAEHHFITGQVIRVDGGRMLSLF